MACLYVHKGIPSLMSIFSVLLILFLSGELEGVELTHNLTHEAETETEASELEARFTNGDDGELDQFQSDFLQKNTTAKSTLEIIYSYILQDKHEESEETHKKELRNNHIMSSVLKTIKFKREVKESFLQTKYRIRHRRHKMDDGIFLPPDQSSKFSRIISLSDPQERSVNVSRVDSSNRLTNELIQPTNLVEGSIQTNKIVKTNKQDQLQDKKVNIDDGSVPSIVKDFQNSNRKGIAFKMPVFPLHRPFKTEGSKTKLKEAIESTFSNNIGKRTVPGERAPGSIVIPVRRIPSSKTFIEIEKERSYNEELFNQVGTYDDNWIPVRGRKRPNHFNLPIPNIRTGTFKDRILTTGMGPFGRKPTEKPPVPKLVSNDMNLFLFGEMADDLAHKLRNCGSHMSVDLLEQYSLSDLVYAAHQDRALIIYVSVKRINQESYKISFERVKRILDHMLVTFNGFSVFNLYPYEEQLINETTGILQTEEKRILLNMNDEILDYCAQGYPSCHVKNNLDSVMWALHQSYKHDKSFNLYNADIFERQFCSSNDVCDPNKALTDFPKSLKSPHEQLRELPAVLCMLPHHRIVEFVLNVPMNVADLYKAQEALYISSMDTEAKRINAQTGLILQDILPLDLKKYDKNRPPKYEGHATVVYFHVTVLSVDSINEESMTYVADIFLAQSWRDHRLRLPENMTEEYRILDVEWLHNIWRPDCFFKNAKQVTFHEMSVPNHYLWLYHDKTLLYMAKLTLVLSCAMKFETYPHDTQICSMMIESLSHTTHDLIFKWNETDPLVVNPDIELPQLDISRNNTEDCTLTYSTGNFTCLAVVFNLRRRLGYHLFHTYIPSAITVVMSWISFWIKPEAIPARVTLGVTSLLTLATQNQQSQSSLPPVSYIKAIDVWMSSCTVFVFASLLEFGLVNHFMNTEPITKDMTGYSIEDLTDFDEKKLSDENGMNGYGRSRSRSRSRVRSHSPGQPQYIVTRCSGKDIAIYIDQFSRIFFPLSFCILNISYWTNYGAL